MSRYPRGAAAETTWRRAIRAGRRGPPAGQAAHRGGRPARRKARTVSAILDAAERHFLERGYESTKVDDIAHDADVAVGSLYNHFGGKEALYGALVARALDLFEAYMDEDRDTDLSAL